MSIGFEGNDVFSHKEKQRNAELHTLSRQTSIIAALATSWIRINLFLLNALPVHISPLQLYVWKVYKPYGAGRTAATTAGRRNPLMLPLMLTRQIQYMCSFSFPPPTFCYLNLCDKIWTVTGQRSHQCMPDFQSHTSTAMTGCIQASSNLHVVSESLTLHSPPSRALPWGIMGLGLRKRTRPAAGNVYEIGRLLEKKMESGFMDSTGAVCCCRFCLN